MEGNGTILSASELSRMLGEAWREDGSSANGEKIDRSGEGRGEHCQDGESAKFRKNRTKHVEKGRKIDEEKTVTDSEKNPTKYGNANVQDTAQYNEVKDKVAKLTRARIEPNLPTISERGKRKEEIERALVALDEEKALLEKEAEVELEKKKNLRDFKNTDRYRKFDVSVKESDLLVQREQYAKFSQEMDGLKEAHNQHGILKEKIAHEQIARKEEEQKRIREVQALKLKKLRLFEFEQNEKKKTNDTIEKKNAQSSTALLQSEMNESLRIEEIKQNLKLQQIKDQFVVDNDNIRNEKIQLEQKTRKQNEILEKQSAEHVRKLDMIKMKEKEIQKKKVKNNLKAIDRQAATLKTAEKHDLGKGTSISDQIISANEQSMLAHEKANDWAGINLQRLLNADAKMRQKAEQECEKREELKRVEEEKQKLSEQREEVKNKKKMEQIRLKQDTETQIQANKIKHIQEKNHLETYRISALQQIQIEEQQFNHYAQNIIEKAKIQNRDTLKLTKTINTHNTQFQRGNA